MKPSWTKGGAQVVFPYLAKIFHLKTFIETGFGGGGLLAFMHQVFEQVHSIEKDQWTFELAQQLFLYVPNVHLHLGDSATVLPQLLESLPITPTMFWLDAHGEVGEGEGPLAAEILAVQRYRPDALVAIDDIGPAGHYDTGLSILGRAGVSLDGWRRDYRFGRVMFLHRGGFCIPELD